MGLLLETDYDDRLLQNFRQELRLLVDQLLRPCAYCSLDLQYSLQSLHLLSLIFRDRRAKLDGHDREGAVSQIDSSTQHTSRDVHLPAPVQANSPFVKA